MTMNPDDYDIAFLFGVPWESYRQRSRHLAEGLAKRHKVLYIEQVSRRPSSRILPGLRPVGPNLTAMNIPFMLRPFTQSPLKTMETRALALTFHAAMDLLGLRHVVVIHCDYYSGAFVGRMGEALDVYDCLDDHAAFSWADPRTRLLEDDLTRRCDLVFAVAEELAIMRRTVARDTYLVPNGADIDHFAPSPEATPRPRDLTNIPSPVLGFVGSLYDWIDYGLLARIARSHHEWHIVLIGPIRSSIDAILGIPNVHLLGERPYDSLPPYVTAFDVALVPFKINALTRSADLIKVYEYLAAGKPVVATDLPSLHRFEGVVRIAEDDDSFETAIQEALHDTSEESKLRRRESIRGEDWKSRIDTIERLIEDALAKKEQTKRE